MTASAELIYEKGALDDAEIQALANQYWEELKGDPAAQEQLGLKIDSQVGAPPFTVSAKSQGIGVEGFLLGVAIHVTGRLTYDILCKIWRDYILKRIKSRGDDSIGSERDKTDV